MSNHKFKASFYQQDTIELARKLLGQKLVRVLPQGSILSGVIVETEAYLGLEDPSCHSFANRRTPRTEIMFAEGGYSYVYFTYGLHFCFNVVSAQKNQPEAVLIRALVPLEGVEIMKRNRKQRDIKTLTNGPAKLCQALQIDRTMNGKSLLGEEIYIERYKNKTFKVAEGLRIGIGPSAGDAVHWPLRFYIQGNLL